MPVIGIELTHEWGVLEAGILAEDEPPSPAGVGLAHGAGADSILFGACCTQCQISEVISLGRGLMQKFFGTWSGNWDRIKVVRSESDMECSRDNRSATVFSAPGNQWLCKQTRRSRMVVANLHASPRWIACSPSGAKLDLRSQPMAEVLSVKQRKQDPESRFSSCSESRTLTIHARNSSRLIDSRCRYSGGISQRQPRPEVRE